MKHDLDPVDLRILAEIQRNSDGTAGDVADRVGISANACWRRMRALQQSATIMNRVALLNPDHLGCSQTVFVRCRATACDPDWEAALERSVFDLPNVVEMHRLAGGVDYRLKLRVADIGDYDRVIRDVCQRYGFVIVDAEFSAGQVKYSTQLPLPATDQPVPSPAGRGFPA